MTLDLVPNPDILHEIGEQKGTRLVVGFAAETQELIPRARRKLVAKHLDLIVANDVSQENAGFGSDNNQVVLLDSAGGVEPLPLLSKREVARRIIDRVVGLRKNRV